MRRAARPLAAALAAALLLGCSSDDTVAKTAKDVLTLKSGTVSDLKARRGTGPFREYPVPADEMLDLVRDVLATKVVAVFPDRRAGEVIAKERWGKDAAEDGYAADWRSAVAVYVHPVEGDRLRSRVEVHWTHRGRLTKGAIDWNRLPEWLDEAVRRKDEPRIRPL